MSFPGASYCAALWYIIDHPEGHSRASIESAAKSLGLPRDHPKLQAALRLARPA